MPDEETTSWNNAANVAVGEPLASGAIFWAPAGTPVPTDASTPLSDEFKCFGYISEDGFTQTPDGSSETLRAWGGDAVRYSQTEFGISFGFTAIEINASDMVYIYGENNVELDEDGNVKHVTVTSQTHQQGPLVIESVISPTRVLRKVAPLSQITEMGDLVYKDGEAVGHELTVGVSPYEDDKYVEDYYADIDEAA